METDPFVTSGVAAMALLTLLVGKLVNRGVLTASEISELADEALLKVEESQGHFPERSQDFELVRAMLDDYVTIYRTSDP
jgi:polyhydroxyalkanoate synthesis regulator phasin